MHQKEEIRVAFAIWELLAQLECLLRDRYFDEFNAIMLALEKERGMETRFPFDVKK